MRIVAKNTTRVHAFIDGVLLGLCVAEMVDSPVVRKFIEVVDNADPDLGDFARQQLAGLMSDRGQEIMDTFEVIYFTG